MITTLTDAMRLDVYDRALMNLRDTESLGYTSYYLCTGLRHAIYEVTGERGFRLSEHVLKAAGIYDELFEHRPNTTTTDQQWFPDGDFESRADILRILRNKYLPKRYTHDNNTT